MPDITVLVDSELMVAHAQAEGEAAAEFIDAYTADQLVVVDSGRIIVPQDSLDDLTARAAAAGLEWTVEQP